MAGAQRGFLLLTAVVLIVVAALVLTVMVYFSVTSSEATSRHLSSKQALFIAGTGLEHGVHTLLSPTLGERLDCAAITGDVSMTNIAFGDGRFTVTGGAPFYPAAPTTLKLAISAADNTIPVNSLAGYAARGRIVIDREVIDYSETEVTDDAACGGIGRAPCLLGIQHGSDGTTASPHAAGTPVGQFQCDLESRGGVPDLAGARGLRLLRQAVQLQEGWIAGDRNGNSLTFLRWNRPMETQWSDASFADAANRENLNDISVLSYVDGWAVGDRRGNNFTFYRLTAGGWTAQPLTDAANRQDLNGVYCLSTDDCWAVGDRNGNNFTFVRRNGGAWTAQPLNDTNREDLNDVFCVASDDCWAVGRRRGNNFTLVRRNGGAWTPLPLTDAANRQHLNGVYCLATDDCWAVGDSGVILRMTPGPVWTVNKTPGQVTGSNLNDVACATASDCWAVGDGGVMLHWDGTDWTAVASPTGQNLNAVDLVAARWRPQAVWREVYQ